MRKKLIILLSIVILCLSSCTVKPNDDISLPVESNTTSGWKTVNDSSVILKNDRFQFELDGKTTHFILTDTITEKKYHSTGGEVLPESDEVANRLNSELTLKIYGTKSGEQYFYSDVDSVKKGSFEITQKDNGIRVYYTFGLQDEALILPRVFLKETFQNEILTGLSEDEQKKINKYYVLYDRAAPVKGYEDVMRKYPSVHTNDFYFLKGSVTEAQKQEINGYMKKCGYTKDEYLKVVSDYSMSAVETENPGYTVPVEYTLNEDGLTARVLTDKVVEVCNMYPLQNITLLEYFGSLSKDSSGKILLPAGPGALIDLSKNAKVSYTASVFDEDMAIRGDRNSSLSKFLLPVFGIYEENSAMFAIIESAAEVASISSNTISAKSARNTVFSSYNIREMDKPEIGELSLLASENLFNKHVLSASIEIKYVILNGEDADYNGMAKYLRMHYTKKGLLSKSKAENKTAPLYIDYLCMITKNTQVMGVPYSEKLALSQLSEISETISRLKEDTVSKNAKKNIVIRLRGAGEGGLLHHVNTIFSLSPKVGEIKDLKSLLALVESVGGKLYFEADFQRLYQENQGDGFSRISDACQYMDHSVVKFPGYDIIANKFGGSIESFIVSPARYSKYVQSFISSMNNKLGDNNGMLLSYSSAGLMVTGDYNIERDYDRTQSGHLLSNALKYVKENCGKIMTDVGNSYVLQFTEDLLNVPLYLTGFGSEAEPVPFYQMLVHGSVSYAGNAFNLTSDSQYNLLRSAEYGANVYYTWMSAGNNAFTNTDLSGSGYSLNINELYDSAVINYKRLEPMLTKTSDAYIDRHSKLSDGIFLTEYSNGVNVVVNYSKSPFVYNNINIAESSFEMLEN